MVVTYYDPILGVLDGGGPPIPHGEEPPSRSDLNYVDYGPLEVRPDAAARARHEQRVREARESYERRAA